MTGVKVVPAESVALEAAGSVLSMIERLASNPSFDADKLEKLIGLQMQMAGYQAKVAFEAAFPAMQAEIPAIVERVKGDKWFYAPLEDIIGVVRPILLKHGYSLSYRTEWPEAETVSVIGILTHKDGHSRESEFRSAADKSGSKNAVQALGSVVEYGRRYTTKDLLGIVTRGADDDASSVPQKGAPLPPGGFEGWLTDLEAVCDTGYAAFQAAWKDSKPVYRDHLNAHLKGKLGQLKARCQQADGAR